MSEQLRSLNMDKDGMYNDSYMHKGYIVVLQIVRA